MSTQSSDPTPIDGPKGWLRDWAGATAFVLGTGLAIGFAVSMVIVALPRSGALGQAGEGILTLLAGGMIAIVAGYLGRRSS